ncbi:MAG: NAD(P)-dependent alcohol dehydrogenase [Candidatus Lambdaproteobacteria bacterium]|nr:NAD(P)-dependent alcohol dehydrogenase [Candidatus Lambdaproteobacteria bacterium]
MKAVVCTRYGAPDVLELREWPKPVPKAHEVLVRICATTVDIGDARMRALRVPRGLGIPSRLMLGIFKPRHPVFGFNCAGEIETVGKDVTRFKPGDQVVASAGLKFGCHAEYRSIPEDGAIVLKPGNVSHEEAAALCFGGITAMIFFKSGALKRGETVLINGASGAVGTAAVQMAKHLGAEVTGVCGAGHVELVRSLGADHVIDYTREDFTKSGVTYDLIMDNVGNAPFSRVKHLLKPGGRFLMVIGDLLQMIDARFRKQVINPDEGTAAEVFTAENYASLMALAGQGHLKAVIDSTFPLERIAEAHARVDGGHKTGSVVITIAPHA